MYLGITAGLETLEGRADLPLPSLLATPAGALAGRQDVEPKYCLVVLSSQPLKALNFSDRISHRLHVRRINERKKPTHYWRRIVEA